MKTLFILNGAPYGDERCYNALRLAHAMHKAAPETEIVIFLMADAIGCAVANQKTPDGYYNLERMLKRVQAAGGRVLFCGTCIDARGLSGSALIGAARRSTMDELAKETISAGKVLVF